MNTWKAANAVVRHLDANAVVRQVTCRRTTGVELRVRDDVGRWAR